MSSYIFDTHSHYDDKAFDSDRDEILGGLLAKGIGKVVDVGADMPSSKMALELAKQYEFVYAALGVHPSEVEGLTEDDMAWISSHAAHEKVAAIGEIVSDILPDSRKLGGAPADFPEYCPRHPESPRPRGGGTAPP